MIGFEVVYIALAVVGSAVAGWIDLKTTDIPDFLTISMIVSGLFLHGIESISTGVPDPFISSLVAVVFFSVFGIVMYYSGLWGGGDCLLLIGIGALVPSYSGYDYWMPFPVAYLFNVLFIGLFYSVIYMTVIGIKNRKVRKALLESISKNNFVLMSVILCVAFLIYSVYANLNVFLIGATALLLLSPLLYLCSKIVERSFFKKIPSSKLREGDMIGENIPQIGISKTRIRGLTENEVKKIRRLRKFVIIRDGIRYGPVFLLSLLFALFFGFPVL